MIKSFKHKGLEEFFNTGSKKGIQAIHAEKLALILAILDTMKNLEPLQPAMFRLHKLEGKMNDLWSITVQANWRIIFRFENENVYVVDYLDYH